MLEIIWPFHLQSPLTSSNPQFNDNSPSASFSLNFPQMIYAQLPPKTVI